ncbi:helix-turn-helix transcriptional regulator [Curtobacterium flaccumfaciens pv. flaccumfaciens]|uniref:Helix-turn-helix transcriptional regulator n=1 Tax=Curtobacterium flaccumfaciens pv. flaccumfaciens TaxID=138532 RepID=A0A9Q2ZMY5_9MICO|nr:helix-turn-helix transcriptional regulator [Curtobacterium flaccumfaciens]MBT1542029.1 helix-turn-helix transcriptional regulator [Curtobacterium flaccumfaciens pv. flaccumfaciens]
MTMDAMATPGRIPTWTQADRLRKARETVGMEQQQLADATGLSRTTVGKYERGEVKPRRSGLILWAMATGVPLSWIETGVETQNAPGPDDGTEGVSDGVRSKGLEPPTF